MKLNEKIDYLLNALKESDLVFLNGVACSFNEYETFSDGYPESICIDDVDGDDIYQSVDLTSLKDISLNNGSFKLIYSDNKTITIAILVTKSDYSFDE